LLAILLSGCAAQHHVWTEQSQAAGWYNDKPVTAIHTYGSPDALMIVRLNHTGTEAVYVVDWSSQTVGVPNTEIRFLPGGAVAARALTFMSIRSPKWSNPSTPVFEGHSVAFKSPNGIQIRVLLK
jgi:hypothetical protein